jgi:hypothetical protein
MKTLKLAIFIMLFVGVGTSSKAQVSFDVHIGTPPQWAPQGYSDARYYYLPDVESYYDVQSSMFIYFYGGRWVHRHYLPARYRNYDLYNGYKVVMSDYRGNRPYSQFREHRMKYARGYRGHEQRNIGERPEYRDRREMNRYESHSPRNDRGEHRNEYRGNDNHRGNGNNGNGRGNGKHDKQDKHDRR